MLREAFGDHAATPEGIAGVYGEPIRARESS